MDKIGYTVLQNFGIRLQNKTRAYRKYVAIKDPTKEASLRKLECIASMLIEKRFNLIIENSDELISYDPKDQVELIKIED